MPNTDVKKQKKPTSKYKKKKTQQIIWAIIVLVVAILIVLKAWEVDFNSIKNSITGNAENGVVSVLPEQSFPLSLDSSKNVKIEEQNDRLTVLTDVSLQLLNPTTGKVEKTVPHGYSNPVMRTAGSYICVFDQGATRLMLYNFKDEVYTLDTDFPVLTACVSSNGTVIYATEGDNSKSVLTVVTKSLKELLHLEVNEGYLVSVSVDRSGKRYAYATVNSQNAALMTTVSTINEGDKKAKASFELEGSNLLDMHYCSDNLFIICDNCVQRIVSQRKIKEVLKKGEVNTCCFNYTKNGEPVYVYSKYSSGNENYLTYITPSGRIKTTVELSQRPKYVSSSANEMTVLFTDKIITYSLKDGQEKGSAVCDDSVSIVHKLSTKCFVCRHQVIDVVELTQKEK